MEKRMTYIEQNFTSISKMLQMVTNTPLVLINLFDIGQFASTTENQDLFNTLHFYSEKTKEEEKIHIIEDISVEHSTETDMRFYAGIPIIISGEKKGVLCIADTKPRCSSQREQLMLKMCSDVIENQIRNFQYIKQMEMVKKEMRTKSGILAHEFINTLSPILYICDTILHDEVSVEDMKIIKDSSANSLNLAKDMLDTSKLELNQIIICKKMINIIFVNKYPIIYKKVTLDCQFSGSLLIDLQRIDQVLTNIIVNALDFIDYFGKIKLTVFKENNNVVFTVHDTGPGIPQEKKSTLFQKFSPNIYPNIPRSKPRSGLGLYICKNIVELHGGTIDIEPVSFGTKIRFDLPIN